MVATARHKFEVTLTACMVPYGSNAQAVLISLLREVEATRAMIKQDASLIYSIQMGALAFLGNMISAFACRGHRAESDRQGAKVPQSARCKLQGEQGGLADLQPLLLPKRGAGY